MCEKVVQTSDMTSLSCLSTSVRMSAGTPVAMRMVQSCCSRPHWNMDFWQLDVAPGELTGDTMTRTSWRQSDTVSRLGLTASYAMRSQLERYLQHEVEVGDLLR